MTAYSDVSARVAMPCYWVEYLARSIDRAFGHPVFVLAIHLRATVSVAILYCGLPVFVRALPRFHSRVFFGCGVDEFSQVSMT